MRENDERKWRLLDGFTDAVLIVASFLLAFFIRFHVMHGGMSQEQSEYVAPQVMLTAMYSLVLTFAYFIAGQYNYRYQHFKTDRDISKLLVINSVGILFYSASLYFSKFPDFSKLAIGMFFAFSTAFVIVKRLAVRSILKYRFRKGYNRRHVVVIGSGHLAEEYIRTAVSEPERGILVDGFVSSDPSAELGKYLGGYDELKSILEQYDPEEIVIALGAQEPSVMVEVLSACEHSGIRTCIIPYYNDYLPGCAQIEVFGRCKLINIRAIPLDNPFSAMLKRSFDLVCSALLLILLSPLMLFAAVGIKLTDPGPILFCQKRVGKDRKPFVMYKFRSMPVNVNHSGWSTQSDARRTKFGQFIRKLSIDELPQLWNVFMGDMSLVGPRPELPNYVRQFSEEIPLYLVRQQVRPGMTGLAQINGLRGDTSIEKRVKFDIFYIENWTWIMDLRILVRTALGGFMNQETSQKEKTKV